MSNGPQITLEALKTAIISVSKTANQALLAATAGTDGGFTEKFIDAKIALANNSQVTLTSTVDVVAYEIVKQSGADLLDASSAVVGDANIVLGLALTAGKTPLILLAGIHTNSGWAFTPGAALYVGTAGAITEVEPSGAGTFSLLIGHALTATQAVFSFGNVPAITP